MSNNVLRGVVLAVSLGGMALMLLMIIDSSSADSTGNLSTEDLATTIGAGFIMLSCAVMGAGALAGLKLPDPKPKQVVFPPQQGAVPPQGQPYQHQYVQPQQQYGQHQYGQQQPPQD